MAKINEIIREMEQLLSSADQSNTLKGRQLAETYAEICHELNDAFSECRTLFRMGAYAEARKLNTRAVPMLTDRYRMLQFSKREDWLKLCSLYGWSMPPELDRETVDLLLSREDKAVELTITELQDQWRGIIRDGSLREKLILARKIYALDSSNVWRSNLLNVERPWVNMLKKEADLALAEDRAQDLVEIYNELVSPDLLQKVPTASLEKYQECVTKYNKERVEQEKKECLDEIASCYAAMMLDELEKSLSKWKKLESNPLFSVTREENIQINDARTFLLEQQAEANAKEMFSSLQNQLEQLLNSEGDPKEIDRVYHSLQQLNRPIKPLLEERVSDLYAKLELDAKRRHVRRCIYWGVSAVLMAILIFVGIIVVQWEREFRRDAVKIRELIDTRQFNVALEYCEKLKVDRPYIAKRPGIKALKKEADEKLAEAIQMEKLFDEKCNELEEKYLKEEKIFDPVIDTLFAELEKRVDLLPEEKKKRLLSLKEEYNDVKESVYDKKGNEFSKKITGEKKKWDEFFSSFDNYTPADADDHKKELNSAAEAVINEYNGQVRQDLYDGWKNNFAGWKKRYDEMKEERRKAHERTRNLFAPDKLDDYHKALQEVEVEVLELAESFQKAVALVPYAKNLQDFYKSGDSLEKVIDQYPQDPFCRDFRTWMTYPERDEEWKKDRRNALTDLRDKTLKNHYKVYELVMMDQNVPYHFYFSDWNKALFVERNWSGKKEKAFRLSFIIANNGVQKEIVFRVQTADKTEKKDKAKSAQSGEVAVMFPAGQKFDLLPSLLTLNDKNVLRDADSIKLASHYHALEKQLKNLENRPHSHKVLQTIETVAADHTITNVFAKVDLLKLLYNMLPTSRLPHYQERLMELNNLLYSYTSDNEKQRWQDPSATYKNQKDVLAFPAKLRNMKLKDRVITLILNDLLLEKAVRYYPVAAGVLYREKTEDNTGFQWRLHTFTIFKGGERQMLREPAVTAFVFTGPDDKQVCTAFDSLRFFKGVNEKELPPALNGKLHQGQLVYFNYGLDSWKAVFQEAVQELKNMGYDLPEKTDQITWPDIWPENSRNITELMKK